MRIYEEEQCCRILVKPNRPYSFYITHLSYDGGPFERLQIDYEEQLRNVTEKVVVDLFLKRYDDSLALKTIIEEKEFGRVKFYIGRRDKEPEEPRAVLHSYVHYFSKYRLDFTVKKDRLEDLIKFFQESSKAGYKTAYRIGERGVVVK